MARSIDSSRGSAGENAAVRGFVPPRNEEERYLMRHVEDLARLSQSRGIARYSSFLSDREQSLAMAALNRAGCAEYRFDGGHPDAERRLLCLEPEGVFAASPLRCVRLACRLVSGAVPPQHKDYLGSLMGLEIGREALGDILLPQNAPGTAYIFALEPVARLILSELHEVGRTTVSVQEQSLEELPDFGTAERRLQTATVSSLRLDAVLAAMLRCSRGMAAELVEAGRVEINHVAVSSAHAPVYEQDVFTIRGKGRYQLTALPGKSKKDRAIIEFFQY